MGIQSGIADIHSAVHGTASLQQRIIGPKKIVLRLLFCLVIKAGHWITSRKSNPFIPLLPSFYARIAD